MRTSEQSTDGPDDGTRAPMSRRPGVPTSDGRRFSDLVRPADSLAAAGLDRNAAYRAALTAGG